MKKSALSVRVGSLKTTRVSGLGHLLKALLGSLALLIVVMTV